MFENSDSAAADDRRGPMGGADNFLLAKKKWWGVVAITIPGLTVLDLLAFFGENIRGTGVFMRLFCDQDICYYYTDNASDVTVAFTSVVTVNSDGTPNVITGLGNTMGDVLKANTRDEERVTGRYMIVLPAAGGTLRLTPSSPRISDRTKVLT